MSHRLGIGRRFVATTVVIMPEAKAKKKKTTCCSTAVPPPWCGKTKMTLDGYIIVARVAAQRAGAVWSKTDSNLSGKNNPDD